MTVRIGLDILLNQRLDLIAGKRVGLVASPSSVDSQLISSVERLFACPEVQLTALFGPEHGLRGAAQAGQHVTTDIDSLTGLPVYSLYGDTYQPTTDMLRNVDVLIFDLQDGGVRFYTYLSTLAHVMQAAAANHLPLIVLDRPAPINGVTVEGPVLDPVYTSFIGIYPIPIRYGMTAGELARLFNEVFAVGCDLTVVEMDGWQRSMWFDQTGLPFVPPSPNLPTLSALTVYPGMCLIEGTTLSEGRGTTKPFEYTGAPWIEAEAVARRLNALDLPGARFRPVYFVPTFSKYQGELCAGVHLYVTDRDVFRPVETALHLLALVRAMYPERFAWRVPWTDGGHYPIDLLSGGDQVRQHLEGGLPVSDLVNAWEEGGNAFLAQRAQYLLYTN
ncbi:MAG: DUF1343 domain-containing protein [Chloroflexi bacterium]|nr:DUF1343 domain-containing protein [Chloroflexota bacterium]